MYGSGFVEPVISGMSLVPLIVIVSVPLGAVGGIAGLFLLNQYLFVLGSPPQMLDVLTMLGFVILIGTVVNNPILIVDRALQLALNAWEVQERLGSPEGELAIAQAVVYMAVAAKSNAVYTAFNEAMALARRSGSLEVPVHLRNAPTRLMKELDYGREYRYAHDEPEGYAAGVNYFPDEMRPVNYYQPVDRGLETRIAEKLAHLREMDRRARQENPGE